MTARNTESADSGRRRFRTWILMLAASALVCGLLLVSPPRLGHAAGPSVVQFSASTYNVQEDTTFRAITVLRTGDVSGPATVDYATASVSASQRSDYATAVGTLRFAANSP